MMSRKKPPGRLNTEFTVAKLLPAVIFLSLRWVTLNALIIINYLKTMDTYMLGKIVIFNTARTIYFRTAGELEIHAAIIPHVHFLKEHNVQMGLVVVTVRL